MAKRRLDPEILDSIVGDIFDAGVEDQNLITAALELLSDKKAFFEASKRTHAPVSVKEFIEDPFFLDKKDTIWPRVLVELEAVNSGAYLEAVLTGGIGSAKTSVALYSQAYQLYLLSTLIDPHREYELDSSSEILIVFQSLNTSLAKSIDYARFRSMISGSPYFSRYFPFDRSLESEMRFPNRIIVKPVSGLATGAIGQNVIGAVLDEANFGSVVESSKLAIDGGLHDQVVENYRSLARRRESRFLHKGAMPGLVCIVSSARYPGQFTDTKMAERLTQIERTGSTTIFAYDKRVWEVVPEGRFGKARFQVFVGSPFFKPCILPTNAGSDFPESLIVEVPEEYRSQFESDIYNAVRDIAGMPTQALNPYIGDVQKVAAAFSPDVVPIVSRGDCDFVATGLSIFPSRFVNPKEPRFAHIDLGITGDSAGVAIAHVDKFVELSRGDKWTETLPSFCYDLILEVKPPKNGEIEFAKIRSLLYKLRELGLNLKWVSLDSFQSRDSLQILSQQGFTTGLQSMDTDTVAYDILKTALYDGRVKAPVHEKAQTELIRLERNLKTGKVDHPSSNGSKDVSDAMAGVAYGLTMRREVWHRHKIPLTKVPKFLLQGQAVAAAKDQRVVVEKTGQDLAVA